MFKSFTVQRESACEARCFVEHNCVSFNVGSSHEDGIYICELSDSDHEMHPVALVRRNGFTYQSTEVSLIKLCCAPTIFHSLQLNIHSISIYTMMREQSVFLLQMNGLK